MEHQHSQRGCVFPYHQTSNQRDHRLGRQHHSRPLCKFDLLLPEPCVYDPWLAERVDIGRVSLEHQWIQRGCQIEAARYHQLGDGFLVHQTSVNLFTGCTNMRVSAPPSTQPVFLPGAILEGMFRSTAFNSSLRHFPGEYVFFYSTEQTFTNTQGSPRWHICFKMPLLSTNPSTSIARV